MQEQHLVVLSESKEHFQAFGNYIRRLSPLQYGLKSEDGSMTGKVVWVMSDT